MMRINTQYLEEIRCKVIPKPERNTKTIIGGARTMENVHYLWGMTLVQDGIPAGTVILFL